MQLVENEFQAEKSEYIIERMVKAGADPIKARNYFNDFVEKRNSLLKKYNGDISQQSTEKAFLSFLFFVQKNFVDIVNGLP
jgi:hypothetical protein